MSIILFDNKNRAKLNPLVKTRAIGSLRMGILTIKERWEKLTNEKVYIHTIPYLMPLYEVIPSGEHIWIDSTVLVTDELLDLIKNLNPNEAIADDKGLIVWKGNQAAESFDIDDTVKWFGSNIIQSTTKRLEYPHQLFLWNEAFIKFDFKFKKCMAFYKKDLLITFGFQDNAAFLLKIPGKMIDEIIGFKKPTFNWGIIEKNQWFKDVCNYEI